MSQRLQWSALLNEDRFSILQNRPKSKSEISPPPLASGQFRLPAERDHDRILFSTPFRRMGDKTQVFPLESIESIRTRLTHSYEVSNLARSMGVELAVWLAEKGETDNMLLRKIPSTLAAVGLAHDLGNPPFGHQGEHAIRSWFNRNSNSLWGTAALVKKPKSIATDISRLTEQHKNDFLRFEGNAQTLRILTRLQVIADDLGLNLTVATLASLMKYVSPSDDLDDSLHSREKVGFFASEAKIVQTIRLKTGLDKDARHPLALLMEACDDIAYSVLDAEDSIKKGLVSFHDLMAWLDRHSNGNGIIDYLVKASKLEYQELATQELQPGELDDVATQKFRVNAIHVMVAAAIASFKEHYDTIMDGTFDSELIKTSEAGDLCKSLKKFDRENAFTQKSVLEVELKGYNVINRLMDFLWMGISDRAEYENLGSSRNTPFAAYVFSRVSRNYRRVFLEQTNRYHEEVHLPIRYRELQLLTDMVSGMTDRFCVELYEDLEKYYVEMRLI